MHKKILYVRSGPYEVDPNSYNLQEIGLANALCKRGYDVDIVYYTKGKGHVEMLDSSNGTIRLLWIHGIKLLRSGIYPSLLKSSFVREYYAVVCSEYSQIMSILLSCLHNNFYVYNGPYYNLFKIRPLERIYDTAFISILNRNTKKIFCKTRMAELYLEKKGVTNCVTVGVGLNIDGFLRDPEPNERTKHLLSQMKGKINFLYIGSISKRKNTALIVQAFTKLRDLVDDFSIFQFILIGKDIHGYQKKVQEQIPEDIQNQFVWISHIKNSQTQFIYQASQAFLLPSQQEIFGMVLLEAQHFGCPVIASQTAGADMVIEPGRTGMIIDSFRPEIWAAAMRGIISNTNQWHKMSRRAIDHVDKEFSWDAVASRMLKNIKE